jgi:hypothetical protein
MYYKMCVQSKYEAQLYIIFGLVCFFHECQNAQVRKMCVQSKYEAQLCEKPKV